MQHLPRDPWARVCHSLLLVSSDLSPALRYELLNSSYLGPMLIDKSCEAIVK